MRRAELTNETARFMGYSFQSLFGRVVAHHHPDRFRGKGVPTEVCHRNGGGVDSDISSCSCDWLVRHTKCLFWSAALGVMGHCVLLWGGGGLPKI